MRKDLTKSEEFLQEFDFLKFNIFELTKNIERSKVLPVMTLKAMNNLNLFEGSHCHWKLDKDKIVHFLIKVQNTYHVAVPYHNDLHGADVMHMCYYFITTGNLEEIL